MIQLTWSAEIRGATDPFVVRLNTDPTSSEEAVVRQTDEHTMLIIHGRTRARVMGASSTDFIGDIVLMDPAQARLTRLVRAGSRHNTFLVTERCDQLCVMCSQPPKKSHQDNFKHFKAAALLAPQNSTLGFSGGEPTLYKGELFDLLTEVHETRPDLKFHVLTNAQHFCEDDILFLSSPAGRMVQWGVPIYAPDAKLHDHIVGKVGAFDLLVAGLSILCRAAANVELRTVLTRMNVSVLPALSTFISRMVPFASPWAIMQLERIGFASNRWNALFHDNSVDFSAIGQAIDIGRLAGIPVLLYNFPLCTVPENYRSLAPATISDWKNKFLPRCADCTLRESCGGFFEWHIEPAYSRLEPQ